MISLGVLSKAPGIIPLDDVNNKGLIWRLGTNWDTQTFANPHTSGKVAVSWVGDGSGVPASTVDRTVANTHTTNTVDSWWKIDIDPGNLTKRRLQLSHMRCQNRSGYSDQTPNNGVVQGSNNDTDWTTLRTFTPGTFNAAASSWTTLACDPSLGSFRYFRFKLTSTNTNGAWYICICEYELFGILIGS